MNSNEDIDHSTYLECSTEERIDWAVDQLQSDSQVDLVTALESWPCGEVTALIESLGRESRIAVWDLIDEVKRAELLGSLGEQIQVSLIGDVVVEDVVAAATEMTTLELADMIDHLPDDLSDVILESLPDKERELVEISLNYPEDSAGRLMLTDWVAVRSTATLDSVSRRLQRRGSIPANAGGLMVVEREGRYLGRLPLEALLTEPPTTRVHEVMQEAQDALTIDASGSDVAMLFKRRDLMSAAVVNSEFKLVGRIPFESALELIHSEVEGDMLQMAGLDEDEDLMSPVLPAARRRMFWLGLNLLTAFLASWVIGQFQATIDQLVALAVLMPIVASMGGIAGSQTLTLAIRGLALGQITPSNRLWLAQKEIIISLLNGVVWALSVALLAWFWFDQIGIAVIIAVAMILNLLVASIAGISIPLILDRMGIDPALSGAVILTTVTDVVGFVTFLGLATLFLL